MMAAHTIAGAVRPLYFGPADRRCAGVLIDASATHDAMVGSVRESKWGVVVCEPFGIEALAADRALNHLAAALAAQGHAVLRFSPPGLGDSTDLERDTSIVTPWLDATRDAFDVLIAEAGVNRLAVVGLRVGASVAAIAASRRRDVDRVVLWAPVAGRPFCRELKLFGAPKSELPGDSGMAIEAGGFGLSAASVEEFATLDPVTLAVAPAREVMVLDRDDVAGAKRLCAHLADLGSAPFSPIVAGFAAMRLDDPEAGEVPDAAIDAIVQWMSRPADRELPLDDANAVQVKLAEL